VLTAWQGISLGKQAKLAAIGEKKGANHQFCVKFSDFCKCFKCEHIRSKFYELGPQNQKNVTLFVDPKEGTKRPQSRHKQKTSSVRISEGPRTRNELEATHKCIPFSQLYG